MTKSLRQLCRVIVIVGLTTGISVHAQTLFVGPSAWYLMSSNLPQGTEAESQPTRYLVGVSGMWKVSAKASLRATLGYRSESGSFTTPQSVVTTNQNIVLGPAMIQVVTPGTEPTVASAISASSLELTAALCFPIMPLDTGGSAIGVSLGGLADMVTSALQTDDYTALPTHSDPDVVTNAFKQQMGFGALLGAYLELPLGSTDLTFDVQYVFRMPTSLTTNTNPIQDQDTGWLIGKGLRAGVTLYFGLL